MPNKFSLKWKIAQAAEIRWWKNYLSGKTPEEYLAWKRNYWLDFLKQCGVELPQYQQVLDAGCGPAGIFMALPNTNAIDALDPLMDQYIAEIPHFKPQDSPHTTFINKPLEDLRETEKYDVVFCLNAINHVADIRGSLKALADSIKMGGQLVISTDAHRRKWLKKIFQWLPGDILHPQQYDIEDYIEMLKANNFDIQRNILVKREGIFDYVCFVCKK